MDDVFYYCLIFFTSVLGFVLLKIITYFGHRKKLGTKNYSDCDDKNCVRCKKYSEVKRKAVLFYDEYMKTISDERIAKLYRVKTSIENIYNFKGTDRQNPNVFYLHDIDSESWIYRETVDEDDIDMDTRTLSSKQNLKDIQEELTQILDNFDNQWLINNTPSGCWKVFHLINQGKIIKKNVQLVPRTYRIVSKLHSVMLNNVFGNVAFSVIYPGTVITDHFGPTNIRVRCHLGLVTTPLCSLTVDGIKRSWMYGKTIVFDDSYLHSVEYCQTSSDQIRAVLMVDLWHPDLTPEEKEALGFIFKSD